MIKLIIDNKIIGIKLFKMFTFKQENNSNCKEGR